MKMLLPVADPTPPAIDPKVTAPPGAGELVNTFLGYGMWVGGAVTVISLIALGVVVTLNAFGRAGDHAEVIVKGLAMVVAGAILITSATGLGRILIPGI